MNAELSAVIFDMDGVLIDSSDAHFQSWRRLAADWGSDVTLEQFRATFGRQNRDIIPLLLPEACKVRDIAELGEVKERYYRELIREQVPVLPGAAELVRACHRAGMICAVGSSGHPENIAMALRAIGVQDIIHTVVSGRDVTVGKPDPEVFLIAAKRMETTPQRCAVIEDAPAGIEAALAAGMTAIGVTTMHSRERLVRAHLVVDRLDQLSPERIGKAAGSI
ncbi:MAG: HAD family phosphatase [Phycisphaerae bacterium]